MEQIKKKQSRSIVGGLLHYLRNKKGSGQDTLGTSKTIKALSVFTDKQAWLLCQLCASLQAWQPSLRKPMAGITRAPKHVSKTQSCFNAKGEKIVQCANGVGGEAVREAETSTAPARG